MKTKIYRMNINCGTDVRIGKGLIELIKRYGHEDKIVKMNLCDLGLGLNSHYYLHIQCDIDTKKSIIKELDLKNIRQNIYFTFEGAH